VYEYVRCSYAADDAAAVGGYDLGRVSMCLGYEYVCLHEYVYVYEYVRCSYAADDAAAGGGYDSGGMSMRRPLASVDELDYDDNAPRTASRLASGSGSPGYALDSPTRLVAYRLAPWLLYLRLRLWASCSHQHAPVTVG